ncbi:hypothetical protein FE257_001200 [Aspergillus nanangensis]|uniref:U3 small nucleolar RNA-associated protein 11 n=1 Tax=Aspergillus nanangensis TaxID=2582783 RepID=A0AAD4CEJ2_ASPNN|nr:hypothetical protein FE257_001200 [Aspergillus nanangensis]
MSSMRNAVHRRQHRERGQLEGREKWGILEKHKDYSLRAKDYNQKKAKLKRLQEKVSERNPDEFAFGMMSSHSQRAGKHGTASRDSATAQGLSHDAIKLLKTQDAGYLRTVGERVRRQIEKVKEEVRMQEEMGDFLGEKKNKKNKKGSDEDEDDDGFDFDFDEDEEDEKREKLVFADDRREQRSLTKTRLLDEKSKMDKDEEDSEVGDSMAKKQQQRRKTPKQIEAEKQALVEARRARKMKKRATEVRENKLKALEKQFADITAAERELDWQRGKMENSVGGTNKHGLKWKIRERKR